MKIKTTLTALIACISFFSNAQVEKSNWIAGGTVAFNQMKNDNASTSEFIDQEKANNGFFNLSIGKAIKKNNFLGLELLYTSSKSKANLTTNDIRTISNYNKGVGVFYRGYKSLGNNFYFFGHANAMYINGKIKNTNQPDFDSRSNSASLSFSPGISYQVLNNIHLELLIPEIGSVGYYRSKYDNSSKSTSSFNFRSSLSSTLLENFGLGFKIFIP